MDEIFNPINYEENNCDFIFQYKNTKVFLSDYTTSHKNDYLMENNIKYIINATIKYPNFFKNTNLSMILSNYKTKNGLTGAIGVIGPKRIDYQRIVPIVSYMSETISKK